MTLRYTVAAPRDAAAREVRVAHLWAAGAAGVWERGDELVAWFDHRPSATPGDGTWDDEPDRDWQASWKQDLGPVVAGDVAIVPSWLRGSDPAVTHVIELDPGQAFGTGHHATTVLCLELLQELDVAGARVLDVGTGTGVLAIAASLLGAASVRGVDTDPDAVRVARDNAAANGCELELEVGSVGGTDDAGGGGRYDIVLANLLTDTVTRLAPALVAALAPDGTVVVSGITEARADGPRRALTEAGVVVAREEARDGWVAMAGTRGA